MAISLKQETLDGLPNLRKSKYTVASEASEKYNCVSLVAGTKKLIWWPNEHGYWPIGCKRTEEVESFVAAFRRDIGFDRCDDGDFEPGVAKIAIFAENDEVLHVAIQPTDRNGLWLSKLGDEYDILHALNALEGGDYGDVVCFLSRRSKNRPKGKRARQ